MNATEIKFRAWYKQNMIFSANIYQMMFEDGHYFTHSGADEPVHIMQYTGLKDCNDKKIYEGDIIKGSVPGFTAVRIQEVKYNAPHFTVPTLPYKVEVIGNIYENPELLEQTDEEA